jgi:nucleotide-binding universal stress UspA family protein
MKKIIVPIDFSSGADNALNFAINLATSHIAEIILLHCYIPVYVDPSMSGGITSTVEMPDLHAFDDTMQAKAREVQEKGVKATAKVMISDVATAINDLMESDQADFVVLGKTGESGFLDKLLGSTAASILNRVKLPMLVVPERYTSHHVSNIVYATQLEFDETKVLDHVFSLSDTLKANLQLLHIKNDTELDIHQDFQFVEDIKAKYGNKTYELIDIDGHHTVKEIIDFSASKEDVLLVLASHHRGLLDGLLNPSVSKKIVSNTEIPTLVYHFKDV